MRRDSPNPLSLEEHRQLGKELRVTNARLRQLSALVLSLYGPNNGAAFTFQKVAEAMDHLCNELENQASHDLAGYHAETFYL